MIVAPVRPGQEAGLRRLLASMNEGPGRLDPANPLIPFHQFDTLHVARLHIERAPLPDKESKPSSTPSIPHTDLGRLVVDTLEIGPELAGAPVSLRVQGSAHLKSLQDATASIASRCVSKEAPCTRPSP